MHAPVAASQHATGSGHVFAPHAAVAGEAAAVPAPHAPSATVHAPVVVLQHAVGCGHGFGAHKPPTVNTLAHPAAVVTEHELALRPA